MRGEVNRKPAHRRSACACDKGVGGDEGYSRGVTLTVTSPEWSFNDTRISVCSFCFFSVSRYAPPSWNCLLRRADKPRLDPFVSEVKIHCSEWPITPASGLSSVVKTGLPPPVS